VHLFAGDFKDEPKNAHLHRVHPYSAQSVEAAAVSQNLDVVVGSGRELGTNVFQPHGGTFLGNRRQKLALIRNPVLRQIHSCFERFNPKYRAAARLERLQYSQQDPPQRFVAISRQVRDDMRGFYQVPDDRVHVVYHGIDTDHFSPLRGASLRAGIRQEWGLEPGIVCFLLVAHNFQLKGACELIEAAARVRRQRRDFAVVIVGKGSPGSYRRLANRLGCGDILHFPGPMLDVERAYAAADVYVQPAWYEPFGLVVLEAWACGLPVIASRFTGSAELMTPGCEGFLFDLQADPIALADRMLDLFDADKRTHMGQLGRALAERNTQQQHFQAMMKVFELAAGESAEFRRGTHIDRRRVA
jgi:UDP-glucose:(heptosyl)LPS alpha-1,3-glucosyltransferase